LPGGGREIGYCTAVLARQRPTNNNKGTVFSVRSAKQQRKIVVLYGPCRNVIIRTSLEFSYLVEWRNELVVK
jgi:hypothetical protein